MYFPYLRGRQYELLALRELVSKDLLGDYVIPIVEPVKLSPTLTMTISEYIKASHPISIIKNPVVGSFLKDLKDAKDGTKEALRKEEFLAQYNNAVTIKSIIMQENAESILKDWAKAGVNKNELLVINTDREYLDLYEREFFNAVNPKYTLIPDERAFRRRIRQNKILLDDKFEKQNRNVDYQDTTDEFFSDDHLYFKDDGYKGFSDYSIIGNEYIESGFAPRAVVIHIVYFVEDKSLKIKHFVSDSDQEDTNNTPGKFYEAVKKLTVWYETKPNPDNMTLGLKTLLEHCEKETYPGLGSAKKLSLMHHLELMGKYLSKVS